MPSKKILLTVVVSLFATSMVFAQPSPEPASSADKSGRMQHRSDSHTPGMDKNKMNGHDGMAEHNCLDQHFDEIDTNKDGKLSREEIQAHHAAMRAKYKAKFEEHFKAADKNGDGALTKAEAEAGKMSHLVKNFDAIDVNRDGKVTPDEMHAYMMGKHDKQ